MGVAANDNLLVRPRYERHSGVERLIGLADVGWSAGREERGRKRGCLMCGGVCRADLGD